MSANESEKSTAPTITSNKISPPSSQNNSNELDDKVQKIQQPPQEEDDDEYLANGGWEDDFTDNEEDTESMKEWETLEFLCQISNTRSNKNDDKDRNGDVKNEISDFDSKNDKYDDDNLEKGEKGDENGDGCGSNVSTVERNGTEKKVKDSEDSEDRENSENSEIKPDVIAPSSIPTFSNGSRPSADNIEQPSSPSQSNIGNRKRRASEDDDDKIDVATLFQKSKKQKDGFVSMAHN